MSDLAPFVAAAIRDKVVEDLLEENRAQRNEIEALEKKVSNFERLYARNPCRLVKLTLPGGTNVLRERTVDLTKFSWCHFQFFPVVREYYYDSDEDEPEDLLWAEDGFASLPNLEIWFDDRCVIQVNNLSFSYIQYNYGLVGDEWRYVLDVFADYTGENRHMVSLEHRIYDVLPNEYAALFGKQEPLVDFVPPANHGSRRRRYLIHSISTTESDGTSNMSRDRLVAHFGTKECSLPVSNWGCHWKYFRDNVPIPYEVPEEE